jgi:cell division protein FtsI (penicillin-binding protein 3)
LKAHRRHGQPKRTPGSPKGRDGARPKRASTGSPTGAIVRPAQRTGRPSRRHRRPEDAESAKPTSRRRNRYGDNGVASLGEARAHQRLRQHSRVHHDDQARRAVPKAKPKPQKQRDRRNIKTTKPLLATRFGAGRPRRRLIATLGALLLVIGLVLTKVGLLQGGQGAEMRASAAELWTRTRTLPAQRGAIFDRNGDELALSVPAATVAVNPQQIEDVPGTVDILARLLKLDPEEAAELQADIESSEAGFMYVRRQIEPVIADQIDELELLGVSTYPEDRRTMPGGDTGQSVIGRTDIDGNGTAGLELQYGADTSNPDYADFDDILRGVPGEMTLEVAPGGRTIAGTEDVATPAVAGVDLITTLDRSVQYSVEQALLRQVGLIGAKGGQVIVLDTDTGDVIAMATVVVKDGVPVVSSGNWSAVGAYEPGSVGKIITVAGALEEGAVTPEQTYTVPWQHDCTDNPADGILSDSHQHDPEFLSVRDILVESSNVGTIYVAQEIGYERLYHYLTGFGLGERTALGFPGESAGILKPWQEWEGTERCTMSYGQGLASTPIQLAAAVNVIANDGTYVAPRLVLGTVGADGEITDAEPSATRTVVSPETAAQMQSIMRDVVCDGTGDGAQVEGLSVAGKTGTAYKALEDGTYTLEDGTHIYYSSFVGFFPAEDPQATVLVSIDEPPRGFNSGAQSAAPLFREIVPTIIQELGIVPPPGSTDCNGA